MQLVQLFPLRALYVPPFRFDFIHGVILLKLFGWQLFSLNYNLQIFLTLKF